MFKGEKFNKAIIDFIVGLGAVKDKYFSTENLRWVLETRYGKLNISLSEPEKRQDSFFIFRRFEEPERAIMVTDNKRSGKWNLCLSDMDEGIKLFKSQIESITRIDKEYLDTFNPGDRIFGGYIKIADKPDNHIEDCFLDDKGEIIHYSTILERQK